MKLLSMFNRSDGTKSRAKMLTLFTGLVSAIAGVLATLGVDIPQPLVDAAPYILTTVAMAALYFIRDRKD
jgi:ABC-type uncharacterized transport system permease subunit